MSGGDDGLRPRPGPAPKLIEGPKIGQRSLYEQQVLDEDTYTEALSHIITRDFFPNLPHLHATNDYLSALANNDPELLSSSIRRLARIAEEKEGRRSSTQGKSDAELETERARRRELEMMGTPYLNTRTPIGARGWDTPRGEATVRRRPAADNLDPLDDDAPGPSKRAAKRKKAPVVRDDLGLDAFQRNYTSEDNASFVQIVEEENKQRREERGWAFEVERVAESRRLEGEERRKLILDAAISGGWRVDANGRRLIGGLSEGGRDREEGEAWKERKLITAPEVVADAGDEEVKEATGPSTALVKSQAGALVKTQSGALIKASDATSVSALAPPKFQEVELPAQHPLSTALEKAGLPTTALVSTEDGAIVPHREATGGTGDGRGRGAEEAKRRDAIEKEVMGDEKVEHLSHAGSGVEQWSYKTMNPLMFPPDAYDKPYPKPKAPGPSLTTRGAPPSISHTNTRMPEDQDAEPSGSRAGSRRGSSPARSWVDAAVRGTEYIPRDQREPTEDYSLVPDEADLEPEDLPPLMTWGTLLATPRALDGSDDPLDGPTFRMPETKRRDEIGRKLGAKASRSISERAKAHQPRPAPSTPSLTDALKAAANRTKYGDRSVRGSSGMLPPGATPRRDGLTPAAKSLLDRSLGRTPQRGGGLGLGSSASARSAAMDKGSGWGKSSSSSVGARSWTLSPAPRRG
ncbi:Splicing factor ESS-2 [Vanrija pseudolonga]|uniref:Splicing factor ESS-2 n=1 Tax=Vanrija pseudolonga TaxID=143232 RepID=A0AAF1BI56_9TREE|nr:Splicing factor ESS-2 [Vanrija pseudolonga]